MPRTTDVRFGSPQPLRHYPHIMLFGSCSVRYPDGSWRSTWGYRVECSCGESEQCAIGSSVSYEDGPYIFARRHAACGGLQLAIDSCGRIVGTEPIAPEPERHETVRLFEPAPTQIPGQLTF